MRKRLVVCFDGTWNNADSGESETNVQRIARAIRANSGKEEGGEQIPQLVLYLRGVGSTGLLAQRLIGGAFGEGVDDNIRSAYMFLAQNYVPADPATGQEKADEIFLFGFSRGAFTARSLAGLINGTGLLKRRKLADISKAWTYYREVKPRSPEDFCRRHGSDCHTGVEITFLGVWDTVGALGVPDILGGTISPENYEFHDTEPSKIVRKACHALAIDEFRDEFVPTLWTGASPDGCSIEQMWFAGAHSDVGGGYAERDLADIPLVWMAKKAEACGLRLEWEHKGERLLPDPDKLNPLAPQHESRRKLHTKDLLTPTIRQIKGREFDATFLERRYFPMDKRKKPLPTINEAIHPLAEARFGSRVSIIGSDRGKAKEMDYRPKNLEAALRT